MFEIDTTKKVMYRGYHQAVCHNILWSQYEVEFCLIHQIIPKKIIPINPLNAELNPIRHLLVMVGARHIVHVSRIRVNPLNAELNPIRPFASIGRSSPYCPR